MEATQDQHQIDQEAIRNCLYRYARGIDRGDADILRSVYWPDATDDHGTFVGQATDFIDWVMVYQDSLIRSHHQIGNVLFEFAGEAAEVESYFSAHATTRDPDGTTTDLLAAGRYCDRFEKRDGIWKIAVRVAVYDWHRSFPDSHVAEGKFGPAAKLGGAGKKDPSYGFFSPGFHRAMS